MEKARELWERRLYWEVHEALEPLWMRLSGPERELVHGVIQLAAALHKAKTNRRGAWRLFKKALGHLRKVPDLDAEALAAGVRQALMDPSFKPDFPLDGEAWARRSG